MRKPLLLLVVLCLAATVAVAQMPAPTVCEIHLNKVKPGATSQYEQGRAKHMAWHKSQNDTWSWITWEMTTGENTGNYLVSSCNHPWKDFDTRDKFNVADGANANSTMGAYLAGETMSYYVHRADLSSPMQPGPPPPYIEVIHFFLKPEGFTDFNDAVKKIGAGIAKTNYPVSHADWYQLANGGRGPEMVLVLEHKTIGDLAGPGKPLDAMMREAYGDQGAGIMESLRKAYYRSESELLHFRSDLSYLAPAAKP